MKFSILQQDLLPVLQSVSRSVGAHATLPILDNLLLSIEDSRLKVAATNLEIGIIKTLLVEAEEIGEITVPAKPLVELVSNLGQSKVQISSQNEVLHLSSGKLKASLNGISASEFPAIPLAKDSGVNFKKEVLLGCAQILFAAAADEGRPILTGILTQAHLSWLDFVATDGFRLAHRQVKFLESNFPPFKSLIPRKTFEEVLRVVAEEEVEDIHIATSGNQNQIIFTIGSTILSSHLIEGQFPSWEKIIPSQQVARAVVDKEELLKALKLASVFAKNEANVLVVKTSANKLSLESSTKELGKQENEIEGDVEGEQLQIAFNVRFLSDATSNCPSSQLVIEFSGPLSPVLIKPMGVEGLEFIVMPVRLS